MNGRKKTAALVCAFLAAMGIAACGQEKEDGIVIEEFTTDQESGIRTDESMDLGLKDENANQQEGNAQTVGNTASEMTADELLDLFINGSINAVDSTDSTRTFSITDLHMDSGEWDSYSAGEKADLDNDGENELVISGPYGGIYLDARDNKVYEFARGEGTGLVLSYTYYNGAVWIMYSNRMHTGYEAYHMEKFEGADHLAAEMNFSEELVDEDHVEGKEKYTWNGAEISYDEYFELCSKIFAAQVSTSPAENPEKEQPVTDETKADLYEGEYSDYDVNEPALEIKKNHDETYQIQIDLFRLWSFDDGVGKVTEEGLEFAAAGPDGNEFHGIIKLDGDIATVTIFGQEWLDFAGLSEYKFYKTSDVPHIAENEY